MGNRADQAKYGDRSHSHNGLPDHRHVMPDMGKCTDTSSPQPVPHPSTPLPKSQDEFLNPPSKDQGLFYRRIPVIRVEKVPRVGPVQDEPEGDDDCAYSKRQERTVARVHQGCSR